MPGTFTLKPIEANLTHNTDLIGRMNPYCTFVIGDTRVKGQICKKGGKHPHWSDAVTLPVTNESKVLVEIMDKDKITHDDNIGSFVLDLNEVQSLGQVSRWYPLTYKNKAAGEILLEAIYQPTSSTLKKDQEYGAIKSQNQYYEQEQLHTAQPGLIQKKEETVITTTQPASTMFKDEVAATDISRSSHVWTEQRQIVEPHTFIKEVEVVETRPALKEIEVMEPVKVFKDVQYTQAIPVKKQIEIAEPQVVTKEVEVIEPRLVTKTIQVVENVPVTRKVEVVEMRNAFKEVETLEPQTFTKQVEVTEYMPVKKQVEVTEPVTLKKTVEFVEPVITTKTITKELQQPVIINDEVTKTVGPASVVGISGEYGYAQQYDEITLSEQQSFTGSKRWAGYETIFGGLNEQERFWEQQRLSRLSEEEWIRERKRLMALNEQERLREQRKLIRQTQQLGGISSYPRTTETFSQTQGSKRWAGYETIFGGLSEQERFWEQQRLSRLSEEEWIRERKRLMALNEQERLREQKKLISQTQQFGGISSYPRTSETGSQSQQLGGIFSYPKTTETGTNI